MIVWFSGEVFDGVSCINVDSVHHRSHVICRRIRINAEIWMLWGFLDKYPLCICAEIGCSLVSLKFALRCLTNLSWSVNAENGCFFSLCYALKNSHGLPLLELGAFWLLCKLTLMFLQKIMVYKCHNWMLFGFFKICFAVFHKAVMVCKC